MENILMFLFGRWITSTYENLNEKNGEWWKNKIGYFNSTILPEMIENNIFEETANFFNDFNFVENDKQYLSRLLSLCTVSEQNQFKRIFKKSNSDSILTVIDKLNEDDTKSAINICKRTLNKKRP